MTLDLFPEFGAYDETNAKADWIVDQPGSGARRPSSSRDLLPLIAGPAEVLFLDIETTGLSRHYDNVTVIGYAIGGRYEFVLAGEDPAPFLDAVRRARSIVTFNGSSFDLPFLEATLGTVDWPVHHVDLRYACRAIGLRGGQKAIEEALQIDCRAGLEGLDGAAAVLLWHRYMRGDLAALAMLIEYNRADIQAMSLILAHLIEADGVRDLFDRSDRLDEICRTRLRSRIDPTETFKLPPPPTHLRRPVHFSTLFGGRRGVENATIVGLDLTGSPVRASGISVMRGCRAETSVIAEDDAILEAVLAAEPDLVSVDSPLCLPVGRTRVTDDDPARAACGIMRVSERILKRRGINVYPCLIPSMQKLTARGIGLARRIRDCGIPVIECYPGAAQDIMGIPRKGAGIEWLSLGLSEFGVEGPFAVDGVSHDELDAITCSLVGFFHLAGLTEALCGEGELPMMVPVL